MDFDEALKKIKSVPTYKIELGIFVDEPTVTKGVPTAKRRDSVTNAEILFINENGSPLHHIPARPILGITISQMLKDDIVDKSIKYAFKSFVDNECDIKYLDIGMNQLAERFKNRAYKIIYDNNGLLAPNALSTIRLKGVDHPLFDTGQLARSINARVVKL